jgi:phenylacetate-CoA ligase
MGRHPESNLAGRAAAIPLRQRLYFAYHRRRGSSVGDAYRELCAKDRDSGAWQGTSAALRQTLRHAARSVPYYESTLAGREEEIDADPVSVLRSLPVLTRETVRARFEDLRSRGSDGVGCYSKASGGSTGEPVKVLQDAHYRDLELAAGMLQATWTGWRFGEREVWLWGSRRDILDGSAGLAERLGSRLTGRKYFNAFCLTPELMRACLGQLDRDPPRLVVSYAHTLDDLAAFAEGEGLTIAPQRGIVSTASTLHAPMRERIERVFGTRVFDQYGTREVGDIACECDRHRGLHVLPWMNFTEILDEDGQPVGSGGEGRVTVTSLCNYAMPMIRYEVGDRARLVPDGDPPCPCGREGARLAEVTGRISDTFKAIDGTHVASGYFVQMLFLRDFIKRFQVVQTNPDRVLYKLITAAEAPAEEFEEIARGTRAVMGEACAVDFEFPDELPNTDSGKYRYTICEC